MAFHLLHHLIRRRTILYILFEHMSVIGERFFIVMREPGAIFWTDRIDAAFIINKIKELAWLIAVHPVAIAVLVQPLLFESIDRHSKMRTDPFEIPGSISWRHGLAAIGAAQAISFLPGLCIFFQDGSC